MKASRLTAQEIKILELMAIGKENKEIAKEMFISVHTVKARVSIILKKLDAVNRTHAIYLATINNFIH